MAPPDRALALRWRCAWTVERRSGSTPQIQAVERTAPVLPLPPGQVERRSHDYFRHGTTDLFAALDAKTGKVIGARRRRRRAREFRAFLDVIEASAPPDPGVHLVLGNAATHKAPPIRRWLAERPRYRLHFTPTSASWLNLVESWFALLAARQLRRGVFPSVAALGGAINRHIEAASAEPRPFVWTKSADEILEGVKRFCLRTTAAADRQETSTSGR